MDDIIFKGYYFNKSVYWLLSIIAVESVLVFFLFNIPREERYILCTILACPWGLLFFYLNRFEPKLIKLDKENFEIAYLNKYFFEKYNGNYNKNEIKALKKNGKLILSNNTGIIAKIRERDLDAEEWETLKNYFD